MAPGIFPQVSPCFSAIEALGDLAQLKRGERCLIHAAAGGVGLVAIQYAQHVGAEAGGAGGQGSPAWQGSMDDHDIS